MEISTSSWRYIWLYPKYTIIGGPGPRLNIKTVLSTYGDFSLKIRRPLGRLIFNMGIAIPGKTVFLIETVPGCYDKAYVASSIEDQLQLRTNRLVMYHERFL